MEYTKYLKILGLNPATKYTPEEIKKAWKKKVTIHHPDKYAQQPQEVQDEHQEMFVEITHAYKMLTDPSYRVEESRRNKNKKEDLTLRMQIPVAFEEMFFGKTVVISYNRLELDNNFEVIPKEEQEVLSTKVILPAGCAEGHEVVQPGKGLKTEKEKGDLFLHFRPLPHQKFHLKGRDVVCEESIPLDIMLKGGTVQVQTMYGLKTLKVPPGTKTGDVLHIKKCGVKKIGNHSVIVNPLFPTKDELKSESWKGLDINWEIDDQDPEEEEIERIFLKARR